VNQRAVADVGRGLERAGLELEVKTKSAQRLKWAKKNPHRKFFKQIVIANRNGRPQAVLVRQRNPYYKPPADPNAEQAFPVGGEQPQVDTSVQDVSTPPLPDPKSPVGGVLNMKGVFKPPPRVNPAKLLEPATRLLQKQRNDADAARQKASADLEAFYDYLNRTQQATQGGLATALGGIAQDAAKTREESLGRVMDSVSRAVAAAGGNSDLMQEAGTTAQVESESLQQQGQNAANTASQAIQAGLNVRAADQARVDKALATGLPLQLAAAYNKRLGELNDQEMEMANRLAQLRFQDVQSLRQFASDQAAQQIAARTAAAELGGEDADRRLKAWIEAEKQRTQRQIASLNARAQLAVEQGRRTQADKDRWIRQQTERLNRQSREKIAAAKIRARQLEAQQNGVVADIDELAAKFSSELSPLGITAERYADDQFKAATKFVKAATTRFGRGVVSWNQIRNIIDTYFPDIPPERVDQLRPYLGLPPASTARWGAPRPAGSRLRS
jgi:hypothetical protein